MGSACAALLHLTGVTGQPMTVSSPVLSSVSNRTSNRTLDRDSLSTTSDQHSCSDCDMAPRGRQGSDRRRRRDRDRSRSCHEHRRCRHRRRPRDLSVASSVDSRRRVYKKIKLGIRKAVPAAIILYPFHKTRAQNGLTSKRVVTFLRKRYPSLQGPRAGKSITSMLRCAVEFGLLSKRGNRYCLPSKPRNSVMPR